MTVGALLLPQCDRGDKKSITVHMLYAGQQTDLPSPSVDPVFPIPTLSIDPIF